ncbi:hypothetical protein MTQ19_07755, partial [Corynebacterium bovis]
LAVRHPGDPQWRDMPTPDCLAGKIKGISVGYDALPPTTLTGLPDRVDLRDSTQGFNQKVEVALADGRLAVRHPGDPQWRDMPTPDCLAGKIKGISVNDDALVALDDDGWIYTMSNLQSSPDRWGWVRAWGGPVWLGDGMQSPTTEPGTWSLSLTGTHTDRTYRTPDGKDQPVSLAKVTQLVALGGDGSHIYSLDPWLAQDYSYEIATPHNGRFRAESVSASGSVVFITDRYGDMYTRLSDYDINGADPAQFRYTWDDDDRPAAPDALTHRLDPRTAPVSLPGDDWTHQPKVPGRITGRISIHSTAPGSENRELRVEGADDAGTTGYWAKALRDETWTFHPTGAPVTGTWLETPPRRTAAATSSRRTPHTATTVNCAPGSASRSTTSPTPPPGTTPPSSSATAATPWPSPPSTGGSARRSASGSCRSTGSSAPGPPGSSTACRATTPRPCPYRRRRGTPPRTTRSSPGCSPRTSPGRSTTSCSCGSSRTGCRSSTPP